MHVQREIEMLRIVESRPPRHQPDEQRKERHQDEEGVRDVVRERLIDRRPRFLLYYGFAVAAAFLKSPPFMNVIADGSKYLRIAAEICADVSACTFFSSSRVQASVRP